MILGANLDRRAGSELGTVGSTEGLGASRRMADEYVAKTETGELETCPEIKACFEVEPEDLRGLAYVMYRVRELIAAGVAVVLPNRAKVRTVSVVPRTERIRASLSASAMRNRLSLGGTLAGKSPDVADMQSIEMQGEIASVVALRDEAKKATLRHVTLGRVVGEGTFGRVSVAYFKQTQTGGAGRKQGTNLSSPSARRSERQERQEFGLTEKTSSRKSIVAIQEAQEDGRGSARHTITDGEIEVESDFSDPRRLPMACKVISKLRSMKLMSNIDKAVKTISAEVNILAAMAFPFITNFIFALHDKQSIYIFLEFVNGGELFRLIQNNRDRAAEKRGIYQCLTDEVTIHFGAQLVCALNYFGSHRIVYRDMKPENILLDSNGDVRITDFGLAKFLDERHDYMAKTVCGTETYMPPEMLLSKKYNEGVDWWAFACVLFEMVSGETPWRAKDSFSCQQAILSCSVIWPKKFPAKHRAFLGKIFVSDFTKRHTFERAMRHKLFETINWSDLVNRRIKSPYIPETTGPDDCSNFATYPESTEEDKPLPRKDEKHWNNLLLHTIITESGW